MTQVVRVIAIYVAGILLWAMIGAAYWLLLGASGIVALMFNRKPQETWSQVLGMVIGQSLATSAIVYLSIKYGYLGPLWGAIVRAIKNA